MIVVGKGNAARRASSMAVEDLKQIADLTEDEAEGADWGSNTADEFNEIGKSVVVRIGAGSIV